MELDTNDTLRIDSQRVFVVARQLSHHTDAGMSAVYLAARKDKPEMYGAIKLAKPAKTEALKREAEHLQKLRHDHIIRLVHPERALWKDRKDGEELHFFALEYMAGGSLLDDLVLAVSRPPRAKKWLLALAGVGILLAIVLIALGLFLGLSGSTEVTAPESSPTPTPTVETVAEEDTSTSVPAVVINVPSREPTATSTPASSAGETLARMPTVTRAPTGTPTPVSRPAGPRQATVSGSIELVAPDNNIQIAGDAVEFRWIWRDDKGCLPPPDGYAFEIRVWRDNNIAAPMGAMDARGEQGNIRCDPTSGIRSFTIGRIRTVPGTENAPSGRFRWDVALIKLDPYEPVITTQYRTFFY